MAVPVVEPTAAANAVNHAIDTAGAVANNVVTTAGDVANNVTTTAGAVAKEAMPSIKQLAAQLLDWLNAAADVAKEELPKIAREIITWNIAQDAVWVVISVVVLVAAWRFLWRFGPTWFAWANNENGEDGKDIPEAKGWQSVLAVFVSCCCIIAFSIVGVTHLLDLLKALFAPRIYLIEYLSELVKTIK